MARYGQNTSGPVLKFDRVSFAVPGKKIFNEVNLSLPRGIKAAVIGASGSGKSSLLKLICGVYAAASGSILVDDIRMSPETAPEIRHRLCYLPQKISAEDWDSVEEFITLPFTFAANHQLKPKKGRIIELLTEVGLDKSIMNKKMGKMSGGERQRLALVRGLLLERKILLLDEPASAIDPENAERMVNLVAGIDATLLAVSHGEEWSRIADTIITVNGSGSVSVEAK